MDQIRLHELLSRLLLLTSLVTFAVTRYLIVAPFGRHGAKHRWWHGPRFDARLSWAIFESPNLAWAWFCCLRWRDPSVFFLDTTESSRGGTVAAPAPGGGGMRVSANAVLVSLFALHYVNRAIVYPLRMNADSQRVPLIASAFAGLFTTWNGYLQCFYLANVEKFAPLHLPPSRDDARLLLGTAVFFAGMAVNVHSDGVLRDLRRRGPGAANSEEGRPPRNETPPRAYRIPMSPLFTYVSCPNFSGEMLEWFGFAMASRFSLPSTAFLIYTASNLIPRAVAHHEWYLRKFDNYPKERRWAVIPFVV